MVKIMLTLLINALQHPNPIEGTKSVALAALVVIQSGLSWLLRKVNNMIGSLMTATIQPV